MNVRWNWAAGVLAVVLISCQAPYVDKDARSNGEPLSAELPPPKVSPQDVVGTDPTGTAATVTLASAPDLWAAAQTVISSWGPTGTLVASFAPSVSAAQGGTTAAPGTTFAPGTGLSGYIPVFPTTDDTAYQSATTATTFTGVYTTSGTITDTSRNYMEELPAFYNYDTQSGVPTLFKKAIHRFFSEDTTGDFDNTSAGGYPYVKGKFSSRLRGEWFKDVNMSTYNGYYAYSGVYEASVSWVMSVVASSAAQYVKGIVVVKIAGAKPYSYTSYTEVPDNKLPIVYNVAVYDFSNKLIWADLVPDPLGAVYPWPTDESVPK